MSDKKQYVVTIGLVLVIGLLGGYMIAAHTHDNQGHHGDGKPPIDEHGTKGVMGASSSDPLN